MIRLMKTICSDDMRVMTLLGQSGASGSKQKREQTGRETLEVTSKQARRGRMRPNDYQMAMSPLGLGSR